MVIAIETLDPSVNYRNAGEYIPERQNHVGAGQPPTNRRIVTEIGIGDFGARDTLFHDTRTPYPHASRIRGERFSKQHILRNIPCAICLRKRQPALKVYRVYRERSQGTVIADAK